MAEEKEPNRADRRRQEKEEAKGKIKATCSDCEEGPCDIAPKVYDKCPVCGCPSTFTVKAMVGDMHIQGNPALFSFEKLYDTPTDTIRLVAVGASCARCGVFRTLARDKMKRRTIIAPPGSGGGRKLHLPGDGG